MTAVYNDADRHACAWLRELMAAGEIADGLVDERSIADVRASDLLGHERVHLFAGIGGWDHALALAGWPAGRPVWTGSCPCPPFSTAGKKKRCPACGGRPLPCPVRTGYFICLECEHAWHADGRHLWPELWRLIRDCRPPVVVGEQVAGADGLLWLAGVRASLERIGYTVGAADLPAASVGAPHRRHRLFWVAVARHVGPGSGHGAAGGGAACGLGDAIEPGRQGRRAGIRGGPVDGADGGPPAPSGGPCVLEDSAGEGRPQWDAGLSRPQPDAPGPGGRFWDHFGIVSCADRRPDGRHKARRVEPGTFPLAYGVPGRVGLLRGYGNAIVPQVAAEFVRAFLEAELEIGHLVSGGIYPSVSL